MADKKIIRTKKASKDGTLETLNAEKKLPIMIPVDVLNPNEPFAVIVNGTIYSIPRGKMVEIPVSVFKIAQESLEKTFNAKANIEIKEI